MEGEDIAPYQYGDTMMHRVWLVGNASANTGEGTGSDPGSGSTAARPPRPDPFQFDKEFLAVGHSGGNQTRGSRGTRGSGEIVDIEGEQEGDQAHAVPQI
jgi:hypothetical protein